MTSSRKGSVRRSDIPPDILLALNTGEIESRSLAEGLAIDFRVLMSQLIPGIDSTALEQIDPSVGFLRRTMTAGQLLATNVALGNLKRMEKHPSDTVRGWVALAYAALPRTSPESLLKRLQPLADDSHFGVREFAWMAYRPTIAVDVEKAINLLQPWTSAGSANLRRFASEATRPRGVWCAHLDLLKQQPEFGLPLLESLRNDSSRYVQDSVANWLNDAAKSQPEWVRELCRRWRRESQTAATERICKRGMRSLGS